MATTRTLAWALGAALFLFGIDRLVTAQTVALESPAQWTQFRISGSNNVVVPGNLDALWHKTTGGPYSSSPTLVDGVLYIGDNHGLLSALDPATGKALWTYRASNTLMSAPIVYGRAVIVGEGDENSGPQSSPAHPLFVGAPPSALIALDRKSGRVLWKVPLPGTGMPTPAIIDGILVHHDGAGDVLGINPADGHVLYKRDLHSIASMVAMLPMGGGRFVTTGVNDNAVWMLNAKDGSVVWKSPFSSVASGIGDCPPVSDGTRIYCDYVMPPSSATPVQTQRVNNFHAYAIDARTGKKVWDTFLESGVLPIRNESAIPLLANGTLYLGSSLSPTLHAIDPRTGHVKWRVHTHGPVKGGIVDDNGILYFGDLAGYLWAVNDKTGAVIGSKNMHTAFNVGSPIVAGQTLIIGSKDGIVEAMPLRDILAAHDS